MGKRKDIEWDKHSPQWSSERVGRILKKGFVPHRLCQAEAPLQFLPTLRKPTKSWLLSGAAQDHTYRVFKTRPLDLPCNFSSSFSKSHPGVLCFVLLCLLNLALLICLDLAYYISDFQNTHQPPPFRFEFIWVQMFILS